MFELSVELAALLVAAAFLAGFVDAIAGGGGLITVPALMLAGLSPLEALSTNKVQGVFGAATAALSYARAGHVNLRRQIRAAAVAFGCGMAGAFLAGLVPTEGLRMALPVVLIGIAVFFAVKPGLGDLDRAERIAPAMFTLGVVPWIAAYDGLIGPGAGSFYMIGFVTLAGYGVLRATAHTKLLNFASNLGGLVAFAAQGAPLWGLGLAMGLAQIAGARLGAHVAMRRGARIIKPLLVVTSGALAARLLWQMV
ncbi:TSUP family transporter [Albidovulum sediminicola]|uniref:Probable membrane transporter protein n=1 Tax=Albidovulum sediminicola TaxID=2984331 RepID=A0ABT2YWF4_9RHOB|nr:TSUP family transporter [Defluviimonas sp. WL0075]MCV2863190.1 TSUP family transporter [Defluviimonas sp. WL0075]